MKYLSTRGHPEQRHFCEILLEGLAPDGGLYLPLSYPRVDDATLTRWRALRYDELAFEILSLYIDDIPADDLRRLTRSTYTPEVFGTPEITPLKPLGPVAESGDAIYLQALSNGPTLAFKDMAMQLLGNLFEYELARRGQTLNILGATHAGMRAVIEQLSPRPAHAPPPASARCTTVGAAPKWRMLHACRWRLRPRSLRHSRLHRSQ
jgi:threonine synthase